MENGTVSEENEAFLQMYNELVQVPPDFAEVAGTVFEFRTVQKFMDLV